MTRARCRLRCLPLLCAALLVGQAGCLEWFAVRIGAGAARLTVRNVGAITKLVNTDWRCGFLSPGALAAPQIDGVTGEIGTVTWRVVGCELKYYEAHIIEDCNGNQTSVIGTVVIDAERRVVGHLTGDPDTPVIPNGPDAVTIELQKVTFDDFWVGSSTSGDSLTMRSGSLSATVTPRMAVGKSTGACSVATGNVRISDIVYTSSDVVMKTPDRVMEFAIDSSDMWAVNGVHGDDENAIGGVIGLFGGDIDLTGGDDSDALDPDYDAADHAASFACVEDLVLPLSDDCDISERIHQGVAQLSVRVFGALSRIADEDPSCGFDSPTAVRTHVGAIGDPGGDLIQTIDRCELSFPESTVINTDCHGVTTSVRGRVVISGTKTVRGYLTGSDETPVVPTTLDAARIQIDAELSDFRVESSSSDQALVVLSGAIAGIVTPRTAMDLERGVCALSTPVVQLTGLQWRDAVLQVHSGGYAFNLSVSTSSLDAVNGALDGRENSVSGAITIDGQQLDIDLDLDPSYDAAHFTASYTCDSNLAIVSTDTECSIHQRLAEGAARLLIRTFAEVSSLSDTNDTCGFAASDNTLPDGFSGIPGMEVTVHWDIDACDVGADMPFTAATSCTGDITTMKGHAWVSARKIVTGKLPLMWPLPDPPIQPQDRETALLEISEMRLSDVEISEIKYGASEPSAYLTVYDATVTGTVHPVTGEDEDQPGVFHIKTPVAAFEPVRIAVATVTLHSDGKAFNLLIEDVDLEAFNGSYNGRSNHIAGQLTVDGQVVTLDMSLDPEFDQVAFDDGYSCTEHLLETVPAR